MNRKEILTNLINYNRPIAQIIAALKQLSWDSEIAVVTLTKAHLIKVITRYLQQSITEEQVETWANTIECREDIEFENEHAEEINEVIHILANPLLTNALNIETAKELLNILE